MSFLAISHPKISANFPPMLATAVIGAVVILVLWLVYQLASKNKKKQEPVVELSVSKEAEQAAPQPVQVRLP